MDSKQFGEPQKWNNEPFRRMPFSLIRRIFGVSRGMGTVLAVALVILIFIVLAAAVYVRLRVYHHGHI